MKKSVKDQTVRAFQTGGYNPPAVPQPTQPYSQPTQVDPRTGTYTLPGTGIAGYQVPSGTPTGYTPYGGAQPYFQPVQFTGAQYQTALQTTNLPTFAETVGQKPGQYDELRTYINDAGQTLQIPFKDGRPIYPIPEGYRPIGDQPAPEEEQTTVTPTLGETTVRDDGGRDDMNTISTTTRASRNVAAGYTKGYGNLSTTSRGGGLSPAAEQAVRDLGITGRAGIPAGGTLGGIANALGFDVPSAFGTAPLEGMTGTLSQAQLASIANMSPFEAKNAGYGTMPETARAVMAAEQNYGVTLSGTVGYGNGDINPVTGTPMRNGMAVDSGFGPGPASATYSSVTDMMNTISRGIEAGWRGGYLSKETYNNLSNKAKENYDKFDSTHRANEGYRDAVEDSRTTGESYSGSTRGESMADAVAEGRDPTGTGGAFSGDPTGMADEYDDDMPSFDDEAEAADDADAGQPSGNDAGDDDDGPGGGSPGGNDGPGNGSSSGGGGSPGSQGPMQKGGLVNSKKPKKGLAGRFG